MLYSCEFSTADSSRTPASPYPYPGPVICLPPEISHPAIRLLHFTAQTCAQSGSSLFIGRGRHHRISDLAEIHVQRLHHPILLQVYGPKPWFQDVKLLLFLI